MILKQELNKVNNILVKIHIYLLLKIDPKLQEYNLEDIQEIREHIVQAIQIIERKGKNE